MAWKESETDQVPLPASYSQYESWNVKREVKKVTAVFIWRNFNSRNGLRKAICELDLQHDIKYH